MTEETKQTFGQEIEADLLTAWHDVEAFGEKVLQEGEALAAHEAAAVKTAIVGVIGVYLPKQIALIEGWVREVAGEIGGGMTVEQAVTGVLNKDAAAGEAAFLQGAKPAALSAIVEAFVSNL